MPSAEDEDVDELLDAEASRAGDDGGVSVRTCLDALSLPVWCGRVARLATVETPDAWDTRRQDNIDTRHWILETQGTRH